MSHEYEHLNTFEVVIIFTLLAYMFRLIIEYSDFLTKTSPFFKKDPFSKLKHTKPLQDENLWKNISSSLRFM